jgi:hypothetical protein
VPLITLKAFAKPARGCLNPGFVAKKSDPTLKAFADALLPTLSGLKFFCLVCPRVVASSNRGLEFANAFGV